MGSRTTGAKGWHYTTVNHKKYGFQALLVLLTIVLIVSSLFTGTQSAYGEELVEVEPTDEEDGGIKQHDLFEFEAFIKDSDIKDGTAPFDANNEAGNDSAPDNKIVRTWDTVSYPVKVTINPKKVDKLENIKLKITGTLENGIQGNRVNAKFAVGGVEDIKTGTVSFTQEYTVKQTGNSIMIPVAIEVQGAAPDVLLTPNIKVEVVSIDGEPVPGGAVSTTFDNLPGVTTSAKVNIKAMAGSGLAGQGIPYYPFAGISGDDADLTNTQAFGVAWGVEKLPGKTDLRGATFPDPEGEIKYRIELTGNVAWDAKPIRNDRVPFDFLNKDEPFLLYDHQPINATRAKIGQPGMLADGLAYTYNYSNNYSVPRSELPDLKQTTIERYGHHMVWESGDWTLTSPDIQQNKVVYEGTNTGYTIGSTFPRYRADGYTGSAIYGEAERVFATHSFIVKMPNEYRIDGPLNKDGLANDANYRAEVILESYTDPKGEETVYNKKAAAGFAERNLPGGSYSVQNTFYANPSGAQIGTPNIGWSAVSKGDASTLIGENVFLNGSLGTSVISYGGYQAVYRWNTDAFELTKAYATTADKNLMQSGYYTPSLNLIRNHPETMNVLYGVAKFPRTDNKFEIFTTKGVDDYTWHDTYDEAVKKGLVGAIQMDVSSPVGAKWQGGGRIPLRVKHENIGISAETKQGTANIGLTNFYPYVRKDRINQQTGETNRIDVTRNQTYRSPAIWDETGNMIAIQSPKGGAVNFETLAIQPATSSSSLTADKATYYNSDTIQWTAKSSLLLPSSGVPENFDTSVQVTQTLPKGLTFTVGSGKADGVPMEPELVKNPDGTTNVTWDLLVSSRDGSVPLVTFETSINPFALTTSVQSGVTVKNVISSDLDQRPVNLRTTTTNVTVLKVGMVGIFETIDKLHGDKNSDFKLTLSPYTTIEDEVGVTGLTVIPLSGDDYGSAYSGEARVKELVVNAERTHDDPVKVYLNDRPVYDSRPHEIDVTQDGWYEYTGDDQDISNAVSVLFYVEGLMTNTDDIQIDVTIQTQDNAFGDNYLNETVINSATDYRLSPVSNRVRYLIRADLELGLERLRIYTNDAAGGLPVSVRVKQNVLDAERVKDHEMTLAIYDTESGDKVTEKTLKQTDILRENILTIPPDVLAQADKGNYEVRIEGVDEMIVWVKDAERKIDSDGYTAVKKTFTNADKKSDGSVQFKGVVMTERELGKDIALFHETLTIPAITQPRVKAGYGFALDAKITYTNELMADTMARIGFSNQTDANLIVDKRLMDKSLEYYDAASPTGTIPMDSARVATTGDKVELDYQLPQMYLEQGTAHSYSVNQYASGDIDGVPIPGNNELYVPIWMDEEGAYDAALQSQNPVGAHKLSFDLMNQVDVYGFMFSHVGSETADTDELLIVPMPQSEMDDE